MKYVQSLPVKTTNWHQWRHSGVFIVNFEHISPLFSSVSIVEFEQVNVCWNEHIENMCVNEHKWKYQNCNWGKTYFVVITSDLVIQILLCAAFFFSTYLEQLVDTVQVLYHIYITREQFDDVKNFLFLIEFSLQALVLHYVVLCRLTFMSWELKKDLIPLNPENQWIDCFIIDFWSKQ